MAQAANGSGLRFGHHTRIRTGFALNRHQALTNHNRHPFARQKRGMNPSGLAVHVAHPAPGIVATEHFHRQSLAVVNPFDRVVLARTDARAPLVTARISRSNHHVWDITCVHAIRDLVRPTFFRSAARGLHGPAARREASRKTRRESAGPANGRASAAAKSWAVVPRRP